MPGNYDVGQTQQCGDGGNFRRSCRLGDKDGVAGFLQPIFPVFSKIQRIRDLRLRPLRRGANTR